MLHFDQDSGRNNDMPIDKLENFRMIKLDEVVEWARIGNDDHACVCSGSWGNSRSRLAMSLSRSSIV